MVDTSFANESIRCTVTDCKFHNCDKNFCSLGTITVGTHESDPKECQCVDCESFKAKNEGLA